MSWLLFMKIETTLAIVFVISFISMHPSVGVSDFLERKTRLSYLTLLNIVNLATGLPIIIIFIIKIWTI